LLHEFLDVISVLFCAVIITAQNRITAQNSTEISRKKFPGDCDHGPREFQSDIIHHRIETKIQAILAAGASKKTQISTDRSWHSWQFLVGVGERNRGSL
jgi:hypothetical protein